MMSVGVKPKSPVFFAFLLAAMALAWWALGMVYTLGHTVFSGFLSPATYNALSYPVAGLFLLISEYWLSGHVNLTYHLVLVLGLGFGVGLLYGWLQSDRSRGM